MDTANRPPRSRGIYLLPNLFTTGGLFAGFYAIIAASVGDYSAACIAVVVAGVLDGLDGRIARMTGTQSDFGMQYDSLADLVSFGMAPALVMYHWSLVNLKDISPMAGKFGWSMAFLYAACAALRLARFNTQTGTVDKRWFVGLASPAAAALMVSFIWVCSDNALSGATMKWIAPVITAFAALMMVSRFRFFSFKTLPWGDKVPFTAILVAVGVFVALALNPPAMLFLISLGYACSAPIQWLWQRRKRAPVED
ncbi:MAG: CDP-diacylglycerol--serine O-phosphatidyltransferase [Xanthomonadales bacterium]|nr:CDP-diacylglycerol--serine O-phosphatidyltransferase [Xanthomonadales bacterium]